MALVEGEEQSRGACAGNWELGLAGYVNSSTSDLSSVTVVFQVLIVLRVTHHASGAGLVAQLTRNLAGPP